MILDIAMFVRVVELGSFAAAAEASGYTPSGISRMIGRIEDRFGTRLLHRTTRRLSLTPEGEAFLKQARNFLALEEAVEEELSAQAGEPRGHLRVNCGTAFARHKFPTIIRKFLDTYPRITIDLSVSDHRIDPLKTMTDVTIRVGDSKDSDLIAVRLGTVRRVIAASPRYLAARGMPTTPSDLSYHDCLLLSGFSHQAVWPMVHQGVPHPVRVGGPVASDSADVLLDMAIEGLGIVRLGDFLGAEALARGDLVEIFKGQHDDDPKPITALILPNRSKIPRVRALVDFLKKEAGRTGA
ncbi:MAG: LysR family transcriptional regulator [Alphaproteobacteria bacterium]|nr:LysR family transcriptional regulator [Alphaproteobacteria bacterium]